MNTEEMKAALIKLIDDAWHKRDLDAAYEIYSDDVVFQRIPFPPVAGKEVNKQDDADVLAAYTETRTVIDDVIVEGDTGVLRWSWEAVHSGPSASLSIPATGKHVRMLGCSVFRFRDGKIVEQLEYSDVLGLLQQLGVIPALG
jgi:steroid delta-isomerase-like uncharacterized protein